MGVPKYSTFQKKKLFKIIKCIYLFDFVRATHVQFYNNYLNITLNENEKNNKNITKQNTVFNKNK